MTKHLRLFLEHEAAGGILLLLMAILAFILSNSPLQIGYFDFIHLKTAGWTLHHFVNDGLMAIFFYVMGLEIKKEMIDGDLSDPKKSSLAIFGAAGGMIVPAIFYLLFNFGTDTQGGWAIPMATDIAFAVGIISLLGKRVPQELKIFLLALAIVDDLGAILVIALFYTQELHILFLLGSVLPLLAIHYLNRLQKINFGFAVILGILTWYLVLRSGIHATIAGVLLAFLTPKDSLNRWLDKLHPYVTFLIMPIFAFFNAGVAMHDMALSDVIHHQVSLGVMVGLILGKPLGIFLFCYLTCSLKISKLSENINWLHMIAVGFIAGIGFTMSLFINNLSFQGTEAEAYAKLGVLVGSLISAVIGYFMLKLLLRRFYVRNEDKTYFPTK